MYPTVTPLPFNSRPGSLALWIQSAELATFARAEFSRTLNSLVGGLEDRGSAVKLIYSVKKFTPALPSDLRHDFDWDGVGVCVSARVRGWVLCVCVVWCV